MPKSKGPYPKNPFQNKFKFCKRFIKKIRSSISLCVNTELLDLVKDAFKLDIYDIKNTCEHTCTKAQVKTQHILQNPKVLKIVMGTLLYI